MKLFYTLVLTILVSVLSAQGIDMDYRRSSPSLTMEAQYELVEDSKGTYLRGGGANISLMRTDTNYSATLFFDLRTASLPSDEPAIEADFSNEKENWLMGVRSDNRFRFIHYKSSGLDEDISEGPLNQNVLVLDADEEGSHASPVVEMPQGRLYLGDDIKLSATSDNRLTISGGDVIPAASFSGLGLTHYDLGKDDLTSHWDDVVANDFVTYSFVPDIALAKSNTSSLEVLGGIKTYQSRDKKAGKDSRLVLNPKELKKVFPEALHLRDVKYNADGTSEIVEIENPGIIYDRFIPLLIDGMQEQKELIDKQAAYIKSIEARLLKLEGK